jgi:hypothetical protein
MPIDRDNIHRWSMIAARIPHFPQRAVDGDPPFLARSVYGGSTLSIARRALVGRLAGPALEGMREERGWMFPGLQGGNNLAIQTNRAKRFLVNDVARTYNVDATTIGSLQPRPFERVSAAA